MIQRLAQSLMMAGVVLYLCLFRISKISGPLVSSMLSITVVKVEHRLEYIDCFDCSASEGM